LLLLLLRLVLHILLVLLVLLLPRLLISRPRKGGISIIFPMSRLASSLLLHHISGALLLTPGSTVIPASSGRACSLPDRNILADTFVADIPVTLTGLPLNHRLLSSNCQIIHLDLLVPAARGHASGTPGTWMWGRSLALRLRTGTPHRRNILRCAGTWVCLLKGLLLLASSRQKLVKPGLLLTQYFAG
jgi:hypothetical protein